MKTAIVGTLYRGPEAVAALARLRRGDTVRLVREPDNRADPDAVAVYSGRHHLGYVPRRAHAELRPLFKSAELTAVLTAEAIIQDGKIRFAPTIEIADDDLFGHG